MRSFSRRSSTLASAGLFFLLLPRLHDFFDDVKQRRHIGVLRIGHVEISFSGDHPVDRHENLFRDIDAPGVRRIFAVKVVIFLQRDLPPARKKPVDENLRRVWIRRPFDQSSSTRRRKSAEHLPSSRRYRARRPAVPGSWPAPYPGSRRRAAYFPCANQSVIWRRSRPKVGCISPNSRLIYSAPSSGW